MNDRERAVIEAELRKTQLALAEALYFVQDATNTEAPFVVQWHRNHAAEMHGRLHLISTTALGAAKPEVEAEAMKERE